MKQENLKQPTVIRVDSNWFGGHRFFKVTQIGYIEIKIEMVNVHGEIISEFPLIWRGLTFDETVERIKDMARSVRATWEVIE